MDPQRLWLILTVWPDLSIPLLCCWENLRWVRPTQPCSGPAKLLMSPASAHQRRGGLTFPNIWPQHRNLALSANILWKVSKLYESKLRPRCTEANAKVSPDFCRDSISPTIGSGSATTNLIYRFLFQIQQYFQYNYRNMRLSVQVLEDL